MKRLSIAIAAMAVAAALGAGTASAAAPRIIIVSGKPLAQQVVIANWQAIFAVVNEVLNARVVQRRQLAGRPSLKLSMFWGPRWNDYLSEGNRASALRSKQADQFGSFYPAWRGRPAGIDLLGAGRRPRVVPAKALAILKRFGVPVNAR